MAISETERLKDARKMDPAALGWIYDTYSPAIHRYAVRLLGDRDRAEDCVAETFHRLLSALHRGEGPQQNIRAYLYRTAHNWVTDQWRRRPPPELPIPEDLRAGAETDPGVETERRSEETRVRAALGLLTPDQRLVLTLKFLEGLELEEIAAGMGKPVGAVKSLQHRGLEALRRMLNPEGGGGHETG